MIHSETLANLDKMAKMKEEGLSVEYTIAHAHSNLLCWISNNFIITRPKYLAQYNGHCKENKELTRLTLWRESWDYSNYRSFPFGQL